jgi:hypothetical protein
MDAAHGFVGRRERQRRRRGAGEQSAELSDAALVRRDPLAIGALGVGRGAGGVPRHELRPDLFETPWAARERGVLCVNAE